MNFSLACLFADLLYLSAAAARGAPKLICAVIAMLMHYFFLVSFTWMSIIAFETWRTFSTISIQRRNLTKREKRHCLLRRIAVGWLPAAVFVAVCAVFHQSQPLTFRYGATSTNFCWINKPIAILFSFVLPIAFTILFNIVFFVLTVIAIWKTNHQVREATYHAKNRTTAAVFFKILILMGFTWIFGILQPIHSSFSYPFVMFTAFTGLYVALAFLFTPRIKSLYRDLLCTYKRVSRVTPVVNNCAPIHRR